MSLKQTASSVVDMFSARKYRYTPISDPDGPRPDRKTAAQRAQGVRYLQYSMIAVALTILLLFTMNWESGSPYHCERTANCTTTSPHLWGQYSPYFPVPSSLNSSIPQTCTLTFALVLSRHGARDPTASKSALYGALLQKIQSSVTHYSPGFEFLKDAEYKLGDDQLTEYGVGQMSESGKEFYERYGKLAGDDGMFVRAAGSQRVVESATNFTKGFYAAQGKGDEKKVNEVLVIPEEDGYNNTLNHGTCPSFEDGPSSSTRQEKQTIWKNIFIPPINLRLNRLLPGSDLTFDETIYLMDLCPFHVVASPDLQRSPFCNLFTESEWRDYDYFMTLDKWYGYGQGNAFGPTQGVGYVNELIARLTGEKVEDGTTTNSTLDEDKETFPLGRGLYADFSHDNLMESVFAAMGLYNGTDLPTTHRVEPEEVGGFSATWTVPFGGRMYVEKMRCAGGDETDDGQQSGVERKEFVRVLVNDRVVKLRGCGGGGDEAEEGGRCEVARFVKSLGFASGGGKWEQCFA